MRTDASRLRATISINLNGNGGNSGPDPGNRRSTTWRRPSSASVAAGINGLRFSGNGMRIERTALLCSRIGKARQTLAEGGTIVPAALPPLVSRQPCSTGDFQALASILWVWVPATNPKRDAKTGTGRISGSYPTGSLRAVSRQRSRCATRAGTARRAGTCAGGPSDADGSGLRRQ